MTRPVTDFKVLSFDCYGTLIDWETGIWDALQPVLMLSGCSMLFREDALESFARHESAVEKESPDLGYRQILTRVHTSLAREYELKTTSELTRRLEVRSVTGPHFRIPQMHCDI